MGNIKAGLGDLRAIRPDSYTGMISGIISYHRKDLLLSMYVLWSTLARFLSLDPDFQFQA